MDFGVIKEVARGYFESIYIEEEESTLEVR